MWDCYQLGGTGLKAISSLAERRTFVKNLESNRTCGVPDGLDDGEENWDFECIVAAKEITTADICKRSQETQQVCENSGDVLRITIVEVTDLARDDVETKRKSAKLSERSTDKVFKLLEAYAVEITMRGQFEAVKR